MSAYQFVFGRLTAISCPIYTQHPPLTELFQETYVLPALDPKRKGKITEEDWDKFLEENVEIRERIMRQTGWKVGRIGGQIGNIYKTLSEHIHAPQQGGDALVIKVEHLSPVQCRGFAALICGFFNIEFHNSKLGEKWDIIEKKAREEREETKTEKKRGA